jgi:hypothetical protein
MKYMRNTVPMLWTGVPVTMTGMAGHDPGISGHVRPESLVTLLRNTHQQFQAQPQARQGRFQAV